MSHHHRQPGNTGQHPWLDPYALASESGTEDNLEDNIHFAGDAQVRPAMGSLYAATRPGAHPINRPAASHPHDPLMYSPRSTLSPQQQRSQRTPMNTRQPGNSTRRHSDQGVHVPTSGRHALYGNENGIGVGVVLSSSQEEEEKEEEEAFHASFLSLPPEPYGTLQAHNAGRTSHSPTASSSSPALPSIKQQHKPPLPDYKPLEPATPSPSRSKRYLNHSVRVPDITPGTSSNILSKGQQQQQHLLVQCEACRTTLHLTTNSVLVKCPKCRHVSSATPLRMSKSGFFS